MASGLKPVTSGSGRCPVIVVAGTGSGVGKTSISIALTAALKKRGFTVQTFKVGPDFLDPTYLSMASGRKCYNLDGWMTGREYVRTLFEKQTQDADIAVIEGVMGLFDGSDAAASEGSTAEIAGWLGAPVLLVFNARGVARSAAAMVKGYCEFEPGLEIFGVIANSAGSKRHEEWLKKALASASLPPLIGAVPKSAFPKLPSRHLGLVSADSDSFSLESIDKLSLAIEQHADMDEIIKMLSIKKREKKSVPAGNGNCKKRIRLGLAFDSAFSFYYQDNLEAMEAMGCELIKFSPIADDSLPEELDGLYIGGGYPELFADELMQNTKMLDSIRTFAKSGRAIYAECGGLVYLSQGVKTKNRIKYKFVGLLPAWTKMRDSFSSLGYVDITLTEKSLLGDIGETLRGHRFHYSELMDNPVKNVDWNTVYALKRRLSDSETAEGYQHGRVLVSYVHAHLASCPNSIESLITICEGHDPSDRSVRPGRQKQLAAEPHP